jgi:hypothetical protein
MTPKQKAEQLVEAMGFSCRECDYEAKAKQCALIAVDEMLTWFKAHSFSTKNYDAFVFYNEVKQEIEAL